MESNTTGFGGLGSGLAPKDPFKQRGGTLGLFLLAIAAMAVVFNIGAIYEFAQNLLGLVVTGVATVMILYVLFDKKFRLLASTVYMMYVTKALSMVIKMDPISVLKDGIRKMYKKIADMEDSMGKLNGVRLDLKTRIRKKKKDLEECILRVKTAENMGKRDLALVEKRQAARLSDLVDDYQNLSDSAEKWYAMMNKIAEAAKLYAQDSENEVSAREEKYKIVRMSHSAFKSAMSVINGDPDELAVYNIALQAVNDDIVGRVGEMDRVVNAAGGLLDKIDVDKEMFGLKGDDLIRKYDEIGIEAMFSGLKEPPSAKLNALMSGKKPEPMVFGSPESIRLTPNENSGERHQKYL